MLLFGFELASTPIMEQSPKNVTVLDGKDATIVCRAIGAPQPNVTWTYNGKISIYIGFCIICTSWVAVQPPMISFDIFKYLKF